MLQKKRRARTIRHTDIVAFVAAVAAAAIDAAAAADGDDDPCE